MDFAQGKICRVQLRGGNHQLPGADHHLIVAWGGLDLTGHVYRYSYLVSFAFAAICLAAAWVVYRRFMKLGGPQNYYVAP